MSLTGETYGGSVYSKNIHISNAIFNLSTASTSSAIHSTGADNMIINNTFINCTGEKDTIYLKSGGQLDGNTFINCNMLKTTNISLDDNKFCFTTPSLLTGYNQAIKIVKTITIILPTTKWKKLHIHIIE